MLRALNASLALTHAASAECFFSPDACFPALDGLQCGTKGGTWLPLCSVFTMRGSRPAVSSAASASGAFKSSLHSRKIDVNQ